jgi:hypothetical protein
VIEYAEEPTIPNRVSLETRSGEEWQAHPAVIANLTHHEVWIGIEEPLGESILPERPVRLVLRRTDGGTQTAESMVLWHIGEEGTLVALMRPTIWDPPSRRAHSRTRLALPVYLSAGEDARPVPAMTTNVGVGGIYCLSDASVPVGSTLPVSLRLTPAESFDCQAEVVRVDENTDDPTGKQKVIALKFLELSKDDQGRLATAFAALADDVDDDCVPRVWRGAKSRSGSRA